MHQEARKLQPDLQVQLRQEVQGSHLFAASYLRGNNLIFSNYPWWFTMIFHDFHEFPLNFSIEDGYGSKLGYQWTDQIAPGV